MHDSQSSLEPLRWIFSAMRRSILHFCLLLLIAPAALALSADNLLLITNSNVPQGRKLAEFYAQQRHVPDHRILELDLPRTEEMPSDVYDRQVVPVLRAYLRDNHLERQVTCLVTFYGVPIRIAARVNTPAEETERNQLRDELQNLPHLILPHVTALESLATQLEPSFKPDPSPSVDHLSHRADAATRAIATAIAGEPKEERQKVETQVLLQLEKLIGPIGMLQRQLKSAQEQHATTGPSTRAVEIYHSFFHDLRDAADHAYDAAGRKKARELTREGLGPFEYIHLLREQLEQLETNRSAAAFDSELALLWLDHPKANWMDNPLNYRSHGAHVAGMLMTMRLDAPQSGIVSEIIQASLHAEREGLKGKVVIDSRGLAVNGPDGKPDAYGQYDQGLRNLAELVQRKTKLSLVFDDRPEVLSADRPIDDVALYMGWYSVDKYVPACQFHPGAVGFHLASFTMVTLRQESAGDWVRGMLEDGIAATLGAVAEPYLQAFPQADDFFPLLMTGKLTLAEVYWKTTPWTSWMISMIGDPLYTPYKLNPPLATSDLPPRLRSIFDEPATAPTSRPE